MQDNGSCNIRATVGRTGPPEVLGPYRVDLFCAVSRRLVRSVWSDASGNYAFEYIRPGPWNVVAYDHTGVENAEIAANLTATP